MNQLIVKIMVVLILFAIIIFSGIVIRRSGKPYRDLPFTLHKLSGIGSIILIVFLFNAIVKNAAEPIPMSTNIAIICFVVISLVSGAIQSIGQPFKTGGCQLLLRVCQHLQR